MISTAEYMNRIWNEDGDKCQQFFPSPSEEYTKQQELKNNKNKKQQLLFSVTQEVDNLQFSKCVHKMPKLLRSTRSVRRGRRAKSDVVCNLRER